MITIITFNDYKIIFFNQKEISLKYLKLIDRNKSFEENKTLLKKYNI